uniref:Uncharacterized protein TCIL3000_11_15430 n=1 Tax=Trypanosoma congolense (strain IL3000) TaxID=1068625 RepID=G0V303_TRYCI|nr:unnamed protein product [Trypanosoma congolense IL3000]
MTSTPDYFHCITEDRFRNSVYAPEGDTFLFLEALDKDAHMLRALKPRRCVEIGCGSGTVISHLLVLLTGGSRDQIMLGNEVEKISTEFHVVDINPVALEATQITWDKTSKRVPGGDSLPPLHLHHGDLFSPFQPEDGAGDGKEVAPFDVVLFNPPYVPTTMEELHRAREQNDLITAAWCGGPRGRVVVDRFVPLLPRFVSERGLCYIVAIRENDVQELMEVIRRTFHNHRYGPVEVSIVAERYTGEHLKVIRVMCGNR